MSTNNRAGCAMILYGNGYLVMNSWLHRVYIQRWDNTRSLHNSWVVWKMNPSRGVRPTPPLGEDFFWVDEWWRRTWVRQNLVFRRGLFSIVIESGAETDPAHMIQLAQVLDAKVRGRPAPK